MSAIQLVDCGDEGRPITWARPLVWSADIAEEFASTPRIDLVASSHCGAGDDEYVVACDYDGDLITVFKTAPCPSLCNDEIAVEVLESLVRFVAYRRQASMLGGVS